MPPTSGQLDDYPNCCAISIISNFSDTRDLESDSYYADSSHGYLKDLEKNPPNALTLLADNEYGAGYAHAMANKNKWKKLISFMGNEGRRIHLFALIANPRRARIGENND